MERDEEPFKSVLVCGIKGCDEVAIGGRCVRVVKSLRIIRAMTRMVMMMKIEFPRPEIKMDRRFSVVKSFKAQNHPPNFDHTRWLFETKGLMAMEMMCGLKMAIVLMVSKIHPISEKKLGGP
ncbi:unnamed protein product [Lupinus luteus]|uniref:Uncharacterized protein n=1 Tax=Lupinus luteus TaxID=3873 RepID=A0AAV1VZT4_LUPLU